MKDIPQDYNYRPLPDFLYIGESLIEGQGLFTKSPIKKETTLGISHSVIDNQLLRFPLGGFINHSATPNCKVSTICDTPDYALITIEDISINEELTCNYNNTDCVKYI